MAERIVFELTLRTKTLVDSLSRTHSGFNDLAPKRQSRGRRYIA
jgi:hypothetical protein